MRSLDADRALLLAANALVAAALLEHGGPAILATPPAAPFWLGLALSLAALARRSPALHRVAAIATMLLPIAVIAVLAGPSKWGQAQQGLPYVGLVAEALAVALALLSILPTLRARAASAPARAHAPRRGPLVLAAASLAIGLSVASLLAHAHLPAGDAAAYDVAPDASLALDATASRFEPATLDVPAGKLFEIAVTNHDRAEHTFTYAVGNATRSHDLPAGATTRLLVRFDAAGETPYRCVLHAGMGGVVRAS